MDTALRAGPGSLWQIASSLGPTHKHWRRHFSAPECDFLATSVLASREAFEAFVGSADEDRGALTLVASTETYTEELPRPKGESATKRAKTAKNARASTDTLDTLEPPTPEAQAQQWRTSHAFKARVRVAVYSHLVDTALFPASASSADDTLLGTQRDLFFAREDPVPLLAARSDFEQGIDDRYYTLEADQRDWAARADIVRQYAASVKQRIVAMDGAAEPPVAPESKRASLAASFSGMDSLLELPNIDDTPLGGSAASMVDMAPAFSPSLSHTPSALDANVPLTPSFANSQPKPPPPMHMPFGFGGPGNAPVPPSLNISLNASFNASEVDDDAPGGSLAGMKPRRKWIKMEKVPGQVELYKALEAAVKALRDYKQHSFPFLQRVKKTDAPDYYNIVKNPMHFAEISKKLSLNLYFSKVDFEADLNLIWSNCRLYNTDAQSPFVVHCSQMEKMQARVMAKVPDIDLTPYKDVIMAENAINAVPTPQTPSHHSFADLPGGVSAATPVAVAATPSVGVPTFVLGSTGALLTTSIAGGGATAAPTGPVYPTLMVPPEKRRKTLLEATDDEVFQSVFDPLRSPEAAISGAPPLPEAAYLPPFDPRYQSVITPQLQGTISSTLAGSPAPGPVAIPPIALATDTRDYPDPRERAYVAATRALRLKTVVDRHADAALPFAEHMPLVRRSGEMGCFYVATHPELVEQSLAMLLKAKKPEEVAPPALDGAAHARGEPQHPRLALPELIEPNALPEPPFRAATKLWSDPLAAPVVAAAEPAEAQALNPDQRSVDLTIDAIRTITRAKVTRDSLSLVMSGYARDIAESKTPSQRGLLDEKQVQQTAAKLLAPHAVQHRANTALHACASLEYYHGVLDHIVVLFLSRMGVDQASRQAIATLSDLFVARLSEFARTIRAERECNSLRPLEEATADALSVFGVHDPAELITWYDLNVVQYAEQMLQSEETLKKRIEQVESERQKRQDVLTKFLATHATEGTELNAVHREMNNAQQRMVLAQRQYYEAKGKNQATMQSASAAYAKAQEEFKKHAKFIQNAQAEYEAKQAGRSVGQPAPVPPGTVVQVPPPLIDMHAKADMETAEK